MENLTQKEMEAIRKALEELGYSEIAKNPDDMARWYDDGTISINTARSTPPGMGALSLGCFLNLAKRRYMSILSKS